MMKSFQQKKMTINVEGFEDDGWAYVVIMESPLMRPMSKQSRSLTTRSE